VVESIESCEKTKQSIMELTIFTINWFDVISVALTCLVIFLVQVFNVYLHILDDRVDNGKSIDVVDKG